MAYNRIVEISIGPPGALGTRITNLRMSFEVMKSDKESTNKAKVQIYNMFSFNSTKLAIAGNKIIIRAGYLDEGGAKTLFFGDIQRATVRNDGIDKITDIEAYDGMSNIQDKNISLTFAEGTPARTILNILITTFGYPLGNIPTLPVKQYANGYSFIGKVKDALTEVCAYLGKNWTIQNEQLVIYSPNETIIRTGLVLSKDTGLLETPQLLDDNEDNLGTIDIPKKRWRILSLLYPQLSPGADLVLRSLQANGTFKVESVTFRGDNRDGDFIAESEVVSVV